MEEIHYNEKAKTIENAKILFSYRQYCANVRT